MASLHILGVKRVLQITVCIKTGIFGNNFAENESCLQIPGIRQISYFISNFGPTTHLFINCWLPFPHIMNANVFYLTEFSFDTILETHFWLTYSVLRVCSLYVCVIQSVVIVSATTNLKKVFKLYFEFTLVFTSFL